MAIKLKKTAFLRELKRRRWSVYRFAEAGGVSPSYVYRILHLQRQPGMKFLEALGRAGIPANEVLAGLNFVEDAGPCRAESLSNAC